MYIPGKLVASGGLDNVCSVYDLDDEEGNLSGKVSSTEVFINLGQLTLY